MNSDEVLEKLERTALAALAKKAQGGDTQAARALLGRVDKLRDNNHRGRAPLDARGAAVARVMGGESASSVASDIGKPPATVRSWVHRARSESSSAVVELVPSADTSKMTPIELLEFDVAAARRDLDAARKQGVHTAIAPQRNQLRKMQDDLDALRLAVPVDIEQSNEERVRRMRIICRVADQCDRILEDRQALAMLRRRIAVVDGS